MKPDVLLSPGCSTVVKMISAIIAKVDSLEKMSIIIKLFLKELVPDHFAVEVTILSIMV